MNLQQQQAHHTTAVTLHSRCNSCDSGLAVLQAQQHYSQPEHALLLLTLLLLLLPAMILSLVVLPLAVAVLLTQAQLKHRTNILWIHNVKDNYETYTTGGLLVAVSGSSSSDWTTRKHERTAAIAARTTTTAIAIATTEIAIE
jgi:hypothetical protein